MPELVARLLRAGAEAVSQRPLPSAHCPLPTAHCPLPQLPQLPTAHGRTQHLQMVPIAAPVPVAVAQGNRTIALGEALRMDAAGAGNARGADDGARVADGADAQRRAVAIGELLRPPLVPRLELLSSPSPNPNPDPNPHPHAPSPSAGSSCSARPTTRCASAGSAVPPPRASS